MVLATLPDLSLQNVEFAREHGRITIGEALKQTGANRNTLMQHFSALVARGHLNEQGTGRGVRLVRTSLASLDVLYSSPATK